MKTNHILLFASTLALLLTSCKKDPVSLTTTIKGKVVTFREDSLYFDGPIEVTLYTSSFSWPTDFVTSKTIYPHYEFEFKTDVYDPINEYFLVGVETEVPRHKRYYIGDGTSVPAGGHGEVNVSLMPETAIRYELINEDGNADEYISVVRMGGGQFQSFTSATDYHLDEGYYNGQYPMRYFIVDKNTGDTKTFYDTIQLSPFDTTNHTIRF